MGFLRYLILGNLHLIQLFTFVILSDFLKIFFRGVKPKGKAIISVKVPDVITSWSISAFSINPHFGMGFLNENPILNVFLSYFIQIKLPYSVRKSEVVDLDIFLYNYSNTTQKSVVFVERDDTQFESIDTKKYGWKGLLKYGRKYYISLFCL